MTTEVRKDAAASRYELVLDGRVVGIAEYRLAGGDVVFPHTVIDVGLRGRGLGARLVQAALDDVRAGGRRVVPECWYVADFIDRHPEYQALLA